MPAQQRPMERVRNSSHSGPVLAFPTAEGYGRFTTGGRGGKVYEVTRLDDDTNPGTLRYAINQSGPRTIVFRVSGNIELASDLKITKGNVTIAGQTAPGDGVCLKNFMLTISTSNVIIRFIRIRHGDEVMNTAGSEYDSFGGTNRSDIIIDHCSISWGNDETASFYDNTNFTMQWCIISESFYHSTHSKGNHGYGGIWGGLGATFHHNLLAHHTSRLPRFNGSRYLKQPDKEIVDFVNNVIYNWGFNDSYGGEEGHQNVRANYYKKGPATGGSVANRILNPTQDPGTSTGYGWFYVADNYVDGFPATTADNWGTGVQGVTADIKDSIRSDTLFPIAAVDVQTPSEAYAAVLKHAGASFPNRDSVDLRVLEDVTNGTGTAGASYNGGHNGIIDSQRDVDGYPTLTSAPAPADSDHDGMPDQWETNHGLNPADSSDGRGIGAEGYTHLEEYLNALVAGTVTSAPRENGTPSGFALEQNYPNPFNPETTIRYHLTGSAEVLLEVHDVLGKRISTLVNGRQDAGTKSVVFNADKLPGGIYFVTLRAGVYTETRKMLLLR